MSILDAVMRYKQLEQNEDALDQKAMESVMDTLNKRKETSALLGLEKQKLDVSLGAKGLKFGAKGEIVPDESLISALEGAPTVGKVKGGVLSKYIKGEEVSGREQGLLDEILGERTKDVYTLTDKGDLSKVGDVPKTARVFKEPGKKSVRQRYEDYVNSHLKEQSQFEGLGAEYRTDPMSFEDYKGLLARPEEGAGEGTFTDDVVAQLGDYDDSATALNELRELKESYDAQDMELDIDVEAFIEAWREKFGDEQIDEIRELFGGV